MPSRHYVTCKAHYRGNFLVSFLGQLCAQIITYNAFQWAITKVLILN